MGTFTMEMHQIRYSLAAAVVVAVVRAVMAAEWLGTKPLAHKRAAELPDYDLT